jgi:hypothetical protein
VNRRSTRLPASQFDPRESRRRLDDDIKGLEENGERLRHLTRVVRSTPQIESTIGGLQNWGHG